MELAISEFGDRIASPVENLDPIERIDAAWPVDFDALPASLDVSLGAVVRIGSYTLAAAALRVYASDSPTDVSQATLLAEVTLPLAGTSNAYAKFIETATVANPGGRGFLVVTSLNGTG